MVTVIMTTYNPEPAAPRFEYAFKCLVAWHKYLAGPANVKVKYVMADDGSPWQMPLQDATEIWHDVFFTTGEHGGIGKSLNRALDRLDADEPWLYTTDDWLLTGKLDLTMPLWLLDQGYDMVRLGPMHPNVVCKSMFQFPQGWWWDIDIRSNQYACATRPFLAAPSLMEKVGRFRPYVDSYEAEVVFGFACQVANVRAASVALDGPWEHIGKYAVGTLPVERVGTA